MEDAEHTPRPLPAWAVYGIVLAVFAVLYAVTAQRGPAWQDSGIYQWRILNFQVFSDGGLALSHPLLIVLGRVSMLLPFGSLAWRINLVSALSGAVAVANIALLVRRLAPDRPAAWVLAAGAFGLAHTPWWLGTICESQMLLAAIFTLELHVALSLIRRPGADLALLLGLLSGLGLTAHNLALLALPGYVGLVGWLVVRRRLMWQALAAIAGGWVVGASGYLAMVAFHAADVGLVEAVRSALFGSSWQGDVLGSSGRAVVMGLGYVVYNFPNLALPLAAWGVVRRPRQLGGAMYALLLYAAGVYFLFAVRYTVPDQFMFFPPFYATTAVWAGIGAAGLPTTRPARALAGVGLASLAWTVAIYAAAPAIWGTLDLPLPGRKDLPRDPAVYWLQPWKADEDSAGQFARAALSGVPSGAVIVTDSTVRPPLEWVRHLEGLGQDVTLLKLGQADREVVPPGTPDVFVTSDRPNYHPAWLTEGDPPPASLEPAERTPLWRVVWNDRAELTNGEP